MALAPLYALALLQEAFQIIQPLLCVWAPSTLLYLYVIITGGHEQVFSSACHRGSIKGWSEHGLAQQVYSLRWEGCLLLPLLCWIISKASLTLAFNDPQDSGKESQPPNRTCSGSSQKAMVSGAEGLNSTIDQSSPSLSSLW